METNLKHSVVITERKRVDADNVESILSLDEDCLVLEIKDMCLIIEGSDLKVENLSKESKKVNIIGNIDGIHYTVPKAKRSKKGILS